MVLYWLWDAFKKNDERSRAFVFYVFVFVPFVISEVKQIPESLLKDTQAIFSSLRINNNNNNNKLKFIIGIFQSDVCSTPTEEIGSTKSGRSDSSSPRSFHCDFSGIRFESSHGLGGHCSFNLLK
jgi:hypothetical protein